MKAIKPENRAAIYKLLSECYRSPDESFAALVNDLQEALGTYFPEKAELPDLTTLIDNVRVDELKVEHARLFLGPFKLLVPPYGSMYMDTSEQLMTDSAQDALRWYESEGMDVAIQDMPDHIRVELEFMYFLVFRELKTGELKDSLRNLNGNGGRQKVNSSDESSVNALILELKRKQHDFLQNHLSRWVWEFASKVKEHSRIEFYAELSGLTADFINRELTNIRETKKI